jgi:DNA-directed RNA polymerase subunit RPC12/RpoP
VPFPYACAACGAACAEDAEGYPIIDCEHADSPIVGNMKVTVYGGGGIV